MKLVWATLLLITFQVVRSTTLNPKVKNQLVEVELKSRKDKRYFRSLVANNSIDVWHESHHSATAMMDPQIIKKLRKLFAMKTLKADVLKEARANIQHNHEKTRMLKWQRIGGHAITKIFPKYDEIEKWLTRLQRHNPFVTLINIGKSLEGRDMHVIKISKSKSKKKSAFIMSGLHGREWLAVASIVNFIAKLIAGVRQKNRRIISILKEFDFYVLPVANPDGYAYSFEGVENRLWRKTRRPFAHSNCSGVDPNRNFDVDFGISVFDEAKLACSEIYHGKQAFSENCTDNIRRFVKKLKQFKLFYDIHSYSQLFLVPYAYTDKEVPKDNEEIRRVGKLSVEALQKVNNRTFEFGSPPEVISYPASGSSIDYMYKEMGVTYSYSIETYPGRSKDPNEIMKGFLAHVKDIDASANEISEAIFTSAESIRPTH